jgi:hypothetical protein
LGLLAQAVKKPRSINASRGFIAAHFTQLRWLRQQRSVAPWPRRKRAPVKIRTSNLLIRSQMLYPVELRVLKRVTNVRRKPGPSNQAPVSAVESPLRRAILWP